jgi:hypothetical protein
MLGDMILPHGDSSIGMKTSQFESKPDEVDTFCHCSSVFITSSRRARVSRKVLNLFRTSCESKSVRRDA